MVDQEQSLSPKAGSITSLSSFIRPLTLLSVTFCLSLAHSPLTPYNQKAGSVKKLAGYFWVVGFEEICSLCSLTCIVWIFYHFYKSVKYMQVRSDACPNLSSASFSPNFSYLWSSKNQSRLKSEIQDQCSLPKKELNNEHSSRSQVSDRLPYMHGWLWHFVVFSQGTPSLSHS